MAQGFTRDRVQPMDWGLVTSLPVAIVGDRCVYQADATNGVFWYLLYDGVGSYPWKFIGGTPLSTTILTNETFVSTGAYVDPATAGPTVTNPLAGDYDIEASCFIYTTGTARVNLYVGVKVGGAAMSGNDLGAGSQGADATGSIDSSVTWKQRMTGLAASTALKMQYWSNTATAHTLNRRLFVTPVRVG